MAQPTHNTWWLVLRAPLHEPLQAIADLERHMHLFLLASKKLTNADQRKTPYEYYEKFFRNVQKLPRDRPVHAGLLRV
jgi:hypothetical protein